MSRPNRLASTVSTVTGTSRPAPDSEEEDQGTSIEKQLEKIVAILMLQTEQMRKLTASVEHLSSQMAALTLNKPTIPPAPTAPPSYPTTSSTKLYSDMSKPSPSVPKQNPWTLFSRN